MCGPGCARRFGLLHHFLHARVYLLGGVLRQRKTGDERSRHDDGDANVTDFVFHSVVCLSLHGALIMFGIYDE